MKELQKQFDKLMEASNKLKAENIRLMKETERLKASALLQADALQVRLTKAQIESTLLDNIIALEGVYYVELSCGGDGWEIRIDRLEQPQMWASGATAIAAAKSAWEILNA